MHCADRSELLKFLGSLFIVVIFIVSYVSFSFQSGSTTSTITTTVAAIYPLGRANLNVTPIAYSQSFDLVASHAQNCNLSYVINTLNETLLSMESNGSVSAFYLLHNNTMSVQSGTLESNAIYAVVESRLKPAYENCINFSANATVELPQGAYFSVQGQNVEVQLSDVGPQSMRISFTGKQPASISAAAMALLSCSGSAAASPNCAILPGNLTLTQQPVR
ncbi:MAG: hypothetical protein QXT36_02210 [Candidatus Micrarchaeaceae archaeon]